MRVEKVLALILAGLPIALGQMLALFLDWRVAVAFAVLTGMLVLAPRGFSVPALASGLTLPAMLLIANALGAGVIYAYRPDLAGQAWMGPLGAAAVAWISGSIRRWSERRCALCSRRIGAERHFSCPRCQLMVCERRCWNHEHMRCTLCLENEVAVFPADAKWWDGVFGPHFQYGVCQICLTPSTHADLRTCGRCGRPQCRHCWDMANGACNRCHWRPAGLPPTLAEFLEDESFPEGESLRGKSRERKSRASRVS